MQNYMFLMLLRNMNVKIFNLISRTNEKRYINGMKLVNENVAQMQAFVMINKDGMKINAYVNAKNGLTKEYMIRDLFGILAIVNVNVINDVILENIQIIKTATVEKSQLINWLKNVMKLLMRKNYIQWSCTQIKRFIIQL